MGRRGLTLFVAGFLSFDLAASAVFATTDAVKEEEPKYKMVSAPSEKLFIKKVASRDTLVTDMVAGVVQGFDSNVNLDSAKKSDCYTEESLDVHFKYPIISSTDALFGFNVTNVNYYKVTDANIFDGIANFDISHKFSDAISLSAGYKLDCMWYPRDSSGTFLGNEFNASLKQKINRIIHQKFSYRILIKDYAHRKVRISNSTLTSDLRRDVKNTFEHEASFYLTDVTKLKIVNQYNINDSNFQYDDYYDYGAYRAGGSLIQFLTKKLYTATAFYYQRKIYDNRPVSDRNSRQKDNLYIVSVSALYDLTKDMSVFVNYSHRENHTNEPLEKYSGYICSAGLYYSF